MKTGSHLSERLRGSLIIGSLITLADFLYSKIPQSVIVRFFADYGAFARNYAASFIASVLSRFKSPRERTVSRKQNFSLLVEQSFFNRFFRTLKDKLLSARLRVYGVFIFAYGFVSAVACALEIFVFHAEIDLIRLALAAACVLAGLIWSLSKRPLGEALYDGLIIGSILRGFVGLRRDEVVVGKDNDRGITLGFMLGLATGLVSLVISPVLIFGGAFAVIVLWLMATKPEFGIILSAFALPFLPTMLMCALAIYCTAAYIFKVLRGKRTFRFEACDTAVVIFMVFVFFGGVVSVDVSSSIKSAAVFLGLMLNYFLIANLIRSRALTDRLLKVFTFSMFITSLIGLYQKFFMEANTTWHDTSMFGDIGTRIYSTFQNPNVYGEYLVMAIPLALALLFTGRKASNRFFCLIMTASSLLALVYTQSRGAWLAFLISVAIYLLIRTGKMLVVYLLGIFSIPVLPFVLPDSIVSRFMSIGNLGDSSTSYRVSIWRAAVNMIRDFFAGGIGIGTTAFSKVYPSYSLAGIEAAPHSHQLFFQIAIEMGIFALIAFLAVIFVTVRKNSAALVNYGKKTDFTLISSAALCGVIGMLIQGMTDYVWYNYRVFGMFWMMIGFCVAASRLAETDYEDERKLF